MSIVYLIEDNLDGIFTAIFDCFLTKNDVKDVRIDYFERDFLNNYIEIKNDIEKANRVKNKLKKILTTTNYNNIFTSFCSGENKKHLIIFNYLVKIIKCEKDCTSNLSDIDIFNFNSLLQKIRLESHRFKGFIRFEKSKNGVFIAKFSPDNDIIRLIFPHFKRRFKSMPFVLHDTKRNILALSNNEKSLITYGNTNFFTLNCDEEVKKLFKLYHDSVNIACRKNTTTMLNFLPKRYHKNMPEKDELL